MSRSQLRYIARVAFLKSRKTLLPGLFVAAIFFFAVMTFASFFSARHLDERNINDAFTIKRKIHQAKPFIRPPPKSHAIKPDGFVDITKSERFQELKKQKARITAISMQEQGIKLSVDQKKLIDELTPLEKARLIGSFQMMRLKQESLHLDQLRTNGHIEDLPTGGERILASRTVPLRFPSSLKALYPTDWPKHYKIYLNLTYFPWENMQGKCAKLYTEFAHPGTLKTAALASFPASGNSWLRYLLDCASGIFTGSLYDDASLTRKGLFGEGVKYDSGMTLLQKTHGFITGTSMHLTHSERFTFNHMDELNHRGVIIIRNLFKALISHRNLDVGGHSGYAPMTQFEGEGWKYFVTLKSKLWKEFYIDWLETSRREDICVVFYEDLKSNATNVLKRILTFLSRPVDEERMECVAKHADDSFQRKRPQMHQFTQDPFRRELKDIIYEAIDDVNGVLLKNGHESLPVTGYEYFDPLEAKISRDYRHTSRAASVNQL